MWHRLDLVFQWLPVCVISFVFVNVCVRVCARTRVFVCVRARACVCVCVRMCVVIWGWRSRLSGPSQAQERVLRPYRGTRLIVVHFA